MGTQCNESAPLYITLLRKNEICQLYTGLTLDAFHSVAEHLTITYSNSFQLHPWDQLLMKLRLNLLQGDLAERFGVSQSIVAGWFCVGLTSWKRTWGITYHGFPRKQSKQQCLSASENNSQIHCVLLTVLRHPFKSHTTLTGEVSPRAITTGRTPSSTWSPLHHVDWSCSSHLHMEEGAMKNS